MCRPDQAWSPPGALERAVLLAALAAARSPRAPFPWRQPARTVPTEPLYFPAPVALSLLFSRTVPATRAGLSRRHASHRWRRVRLLRADPSLLRIEKRDEGWPWDGHDGLCVTAITRRDNPSCASTRLETAFRACNIMERNCGDTPRLRAAWACRGYARQYRLRASTGSRIAGTLTEYGTTVNH